MVRRAVAATVLACCIAGAVGLAISIPGGGAGAPPHEPGTTIDDAATGPPRTTVPDDASDAVAGVTDESAGPTDSPAPDNSTATPATVGSRVPSATDPARVLLVGDSQAQGLEPFLEAELDGDAFTTLTTFGRNSSGFVRPDFFDWPARLAELVATERPDVVVMFIGGNETQQFLHMRDKPIDSPEWRAEYGTRIGGAMDLLRADGRTLIWIGVPMPGEAWQRSRLIVQNEVVRAQAAARPDVVFIDTWVLLSGIDGGYAPLVFDPLTGTYRAVRSDRDEFHLNVAGTKLVAAAVNQAITNDLTRRGTPDIAARPTTTIDFTAAGTYTIEANDSLSAIATKTGTTVDAIVVANGWADHTQLIIPGQDITLPARAS